ncbi:MAG TPA: hypothetical protein VIN10_11520 [Bacteroidales bacterium]
MNRKIEHNNSPKFSERKYTKSNSILSDIRYFFIQKSEIDTLVKFQPENGRQQYNQLIFDRIGLEVDKFKMLNIHQIAIDVPVDFLFGELMKWNSDSCWWPNHIAKVHALDDRLSRINVFLFGKINFSFKKQKKSPEFHLLRLFNFKLIKKENNSSPENKNAHYLLYECSGGYPIGVFSLFMRDSIPENNETCKSQLFMMVSFNFYGIKSLSRIKMITKTWEAIHNRVTSNSLNRIKNYCEMNFQNQVST